MAGLVWLNSHDYTVCSNSDDDILNVTVFPHKRSRKVHTHTTGFSINHILSWSFHDILGNRKFNMLLIEILKTPGRPLTDNIFCWNPANALQCSRSGLSCDKNKASETQERGDNGVGGQYAIQHNTQLVIACFF